MTAPARKLSAVADAPEQAETCAACRQSEAEHRKERKQLRAQVRELTDRVDRLTRALQRESVYMDERVIRNK